MEHVTGVLTCAIGMPEGALTGASLAVEPLDVAAPNTPEAGGYSAPET